MPSPLDFAYRNKADFVVARGESTFHIGFFARGSHSVIDVSQCPIQQSPNNAILAAAREALSQKLAEPFDARSGRGVLRRLVARTASSGETLLVAVTTRAQWKHEKEFARFMRARVPSLVGVLRREPKSAAQVVAGRDWLEEKVLLSDGELRLRVSGEGFFQINTSLTPRLVQTALCLMEVERGERVLDLFCGVGLFSLALAQRGAHVAGIEANGAAVRDARFNAPRNDCRAEFITADAARALRDFEAGAFSKVLLDPPRDGAAEVMPELLRLQPRRIVYVSCDPATLARDLKVLLARDCRLVEVVPLDLFPQTAHVETVACLQRRV